MELDGYPYVWALGLHGKIQSLWGMCVQSLALTRTSLVELTYLTTLFVIRIVVSALASTAAPAWTASTPSPACCLPGFTGQLLPTRHQRVRLQALRERRHLPGQLRHLQVHLPTGIHGGQLPGRRGTHTIVVFNKFDLFFFVIILCICYSNF